MTRRNWVWTVGAGVWVALAPGCTHLTSDPVTPTKLPLAAGRDKPASGAVASTDADAPVRPPVRPANAPVAVVKTPTVEQAQYPTVQPAPEHGTQPPPILDPETTPKVMPARHQEVAKTEVKPKPVEDPPLVTALRLFLSNHPVEARALLDRYDSRTQDLLLCLLPMLARLGETKLAAQSPQETAAMLEQLEQVMQALRPRAPLSVGKICFCESIQSYGVYKPLREDNPEFQPDDHVLVYVELRNASSVPQRDQFAVRLGGEVKIVDYMGNRIWAKTLQNRPDFSRAPRTDYFTVCQFGLPRDIRPGAYVLHVLIIDEPTGRAVRRTLDFHVVPARGIGE
jgi:hypothetical protein